MTEVTTAEIRGKYEYWFDPKQLHAKDLYLQRTYGISLEEYFKILAFQGGACAIEVCNKEPDRSWLDVDHDHVAKTVRGLLCRYHNHRLIGRHRDWTLLYAAAHYLHHPPAVSVLGSGHQIPKKKRRKKRATKK
jgi:recombination endonuclease VII